MQSLLPNNISVCPWTYAIRNITPWLRASQEAWQAWCAWRLTASPCKCGRLWTAISCYHMHQLIALRAQALHTPVYTTCVGCHTLKHDSNIILQTLLMDEAGLDIASLRRLSR